MLLVVAVVAIVRPPASGIVALLPAVGGLWDEDTSCTVPVRPCAADVPTAAFQGHRWSSSEC